MLRIHLCKCMKKYLFVITKKVKQRYVDLAFLEKNYPGYFFWTAFGQNALESFILKGFGTLVIGFESRTGHQKTAFMQKMVA